MAYVQDPWKDDEDERMGGVAGGTLVGGSPGGVSVGGQPQDDQQQQDGAAVPQLSRGVSSGASSGVAQSPSQQKNSGSWTNVTAFLEANRGAGKSMAQRVTGNTQTKIGDFAGKTNKVESDVVNTVDANTVKADPNLVAQVRTNPTAVDKGAYQRLATASYKGPRDVTEAAGTQLAELGVQKSKIDDRLNKSGTDVGRRELLKEDYAPKQYSTGESALDGLFLQADGGDVFQGAANQAKGYDTPFKGITDRIGTKIAGAKAASQAAVDELKRATGETMGAVRSRIDKGMADLTASERRKFDEFSKVGQALSRKDLNELKRLGVDPKSAQWAMSQGWDPSKLISAGKSQSLADFVDDGTIASLAALQDLTGSGDLTGGYNFGQRGQGSADPYSVNQGMVAAVRDGLSLQNRLTSKRDETNRQRDDVYRSAINTRSLAKALGMDQRDIDYFVGGGADQFINYMRAQSDPRNWQGGLIPTADDKDYGRVFDQRKVNDFYKGLANSIKRGANVNLGDVASDKDRADWSKIREALGVNLQSLADTQDEGAAYTPADVAQFKAQIEAKKREYQAAQQGLREAIQREASRAPIADSSNRDWVVEEEIDRGNRPREGGGGYPGMSSMRLSDEKKKTDIKPAKFGRLKASLGR